MKSSVTIILSATLIIFGCSSKPDVIQEDSEPSRMDHGIKRIVCSSGLSLPHHIEIQSDGYVIYKGYNDFYETDNQYHYSALYIGNIGQDMFDEFAHRLVENNFTQPTTFETPNNQPTPGNYLHAFIYYSDTVKFLSHYNDSVTSILMEVLNLRHEANLSLLSEKSLKVFESEIPPSELK